MKAAKMDTYALEQQIPAVALADKQRREALA
jgi:hypothetical protein